MPPFQAALAQSHAQLPSWTLEPVPQPILTLLPQVTALFSAQNKLSCVSQGSSRGCIPPVLGLAR